MATLANLSNQTYYFDNISATQTGIILRGGLYGITTVATFGGGSVTLQRLARDNSTYVTVLAAITAAGFATVSLPPGTYRLLVATATAIYIDITAIAAGG